MAGEVLLEDHQEELEQVLTMNDAFIQEFLVTHQELYQQYPVLELADLEKSATLIADLSQYIISEAIKKDYLINTYKQSLQISSRKRRAGAIEYDPKRYSTNFVNCSINSFKCLSN